MWLAVGPLACTAVRAATPTTDFGMRVVPASLSISVNPGQARTSPLTVGLSFGSLQSAVSLARSYGRVTSTLRTPAHNRAVGGVRNSFHLSGRAIDIARRPGVRHADIDAAFRRAGFHLLESLDEGDHSHVAFGFGSRPVARVAAIKVAPAEATEWRVVYAPRGSR